MLSRLYRVLGIMSGTSLDGLDLTLCSFSNDSGKWNYKIEKTLTLPYDNDWKKNLAEAGRLNAFEFIALHKEYGRYTGRKAIEFLGNEKNTVDFIASHGHTVFHEPEKQITFQIGDGASIAAMTGLTTISDFRNLDVAMGGQGAPLVPVGDELLFGDYDYCLNLGGFSNISYHSENKRIAFDICPVNIVLNRFAQHAGLDFDKDGNLGRQGKVNHDLLNELNSLEYYRVKPPKSLGREWLEIHFLPVVEKYPVSEADIIRTLYEHIVFQISKSAAGNLKKILVTGGGVYNLFLMELLQKQTTFNIIIPDRQVVEYKEALIFAFLGVLRFMKKPNCLSSVTGASMDNCGGSIFEVPGKHLVVNLHKAEF